MEAKAEPKNAQAAPNGAPAQPERTVDTIRELLFGDRIRMFEERFSLLDQTVQTEQNSLREAFEKRFGQLQAQLQEQGQRLQTAIEAEKQARVAEIKRVSDQLQATADQFRQKMEGLSNDHQTLKQDSQREMLSLSKKLFKEIQDASARLNTLVETESAEIRKSKADRREVAQGLTQLAQSLEKAAGAPAKP